MNDLNKSVLDINSLPAFVKIRAMPHFPGEMAVFLAGCRADVWISSYIELQGFIS
jgi:hypothetical protein